MLATFCKMASLIEAEEASCACESFNYFNIFTSTNLGNKKWPLIKYARWDGTCWQQVDRKDGGLYLIVENMQILVVQQGTAIESVCLAPGSTQLKGVWKDDILVIIIKQQTITRRFRVKFAATEFKSEITNCKECVYVLSYYINIHDTTDPRKRELKSITDWYNSFMKYQTSEKNTIIECLTPDPLPSSFPIDKTVQLCILDPGFLELVDKVELSLQKMQL